MNSDEESIGPLPSVALDQNIGFRRTSRADIGGSKNKRRTGVLESTYLSNMPSSDAYEYSYMHRDVVTHVVVSKPCNFIITASLDGQVKFWKKMLEGIEFVKHFQVFSLISIVLNIALLYHTCHFYQFATIFSIPLHSRFTLLSALDTSYEFKT